jgi:hypothetical protein
VTDWKISQLAIQATPSASDYVPILRPSDTTTPPAGAAGSDQRTTIANLVAAAGGGGAVPGMQVIWMDALGADHTGATSVTSIFNTALATAGSSPCLFVFGVGTYLWSTAPNHLGLGQYVQGQGQFVTGFTWAGSGPLFTVVEPGTFNGGHRAGRLSGFSINGPFGSGGTAGVKFGALQSFMLDDVGFFGLDGGAVLGYKSGAGDWAEEAVMTRLNISECGATSGYVFNFTGTSFDYALIDAVVVVEANIDIVSLLGGAQLQGLDLRIRGNVHGGSTNTGAIVAIDRGNTGGNSYLTNATFAVSMEAGNAGAGTVGHYLLWMGNTSSVSQFRATGTFNIYNAGIAGQGIHNPSNLPASFSAIVNDPSGGSMSAGAAHAFLGGTRWTPAGDGFGSLFASTVFWQFGDVVTAQLAVGTTTLVFSGTDGFVIRGVLYVKEPGSGTTVVNWPGTVTWIGTAPTWSNAGKVHKILCDYLPAENTWYLQWAGHS